MLRTMDVRETPAWRRAIGLAHEVCAALEDKHDLPGDSGQRLRRAALAVPSLVAEAFLDTGVDDCRERLSAAADRVAELRQLLRAPELGLFVPGPEADALLAEVESLAMEIRTLGGRCHEA
jgi:four helix bundle protein